MLKKSRRFSEVASTLCERVSQPTFEGYWVCRGPICAAPPKSVSQCDITLLWIHGGGYVGGRALTGVSRFLRIAELAAEEGLSINIFTLEYSLAPEAKFPVQIEEATAAYKYMIEDEGIDPSSIMVFGESAGGHLALSLACIIHQLGLPRPGNIGLNYPWVNLENSGHSFLTNKNKDVLDKGDLDRCVDGLLGEEGRLKFDHFLNFGSATRPNGRDWSLILPPTTVLIGGNDLFVSDVCSFVDEVRKDGVTVDLQIEPGRPHGWLAMIDFLSERKYLRLSPSDDASSVLPGCEVMAKVICARGDANRS